MSLTLTGPNLNERVYDELRQRILTRQEPSGAKLSLHSLADELGVSRSPVHHALTRLVSEGLLTVRPRRGYYVAPVTARAVAEGYDVRLALELLAAERAVGRIDEEDGDRLRDLLAATDAAISHEQWDAANAAFHELQIDLAGNALLSRFYRELSVNLMMQVIRGGRVEGHADLVIEHRRIVDALTAGDLAGAQYAIREHIESGRRIALDAIERAGGVL
jgi:DNA-binding GntR family transcriptional regulator